MEQIAEPSSAPIPAREKASQDKGVFALLYLSMLAMGTNNSMMQALAAPIVRQFGLPAAAIGGLFSLSALIWAFACPFWGRLSDRIGRQPVILLGLIAVFVSNLFFAGALIAGDAGLIGGLNLFICLCLARSLYGLFGSGFLAPTQAIVAEQTHPSERIKRLGLLMSAASLGQIFGPGVAGAVAVRLGLVSPIVAFALVYLALSIAAFFMIKETDKPPRPAADAEPQTSLLEAARSPKLAPFLTYGVLMAIVTGVQAQVFGLYVMDRLHVNGVHGAEAAAIGFMTCAAAVLTTQVLLLPQLKFGSRILMAAGGVALALALIVEIAAYTMPVMLIGQALLGLGYGLARPGFIGGASAAMSGDQGAVAGLSSAAIGAGWVVAPLLGGVIYDAIGITAPFWIALAGAFAMIAYTMLSKGLKAAAI